jgi:hypothetical protein
MDTELIAGMASTAAEAAISHLSDLGTLSIAFLPQQRSRFSVTPASCVGPACRRELGIEPLYGGKIKQQSLRFLHCHRNVLLAKDQGTLDCPGPLTAKVASRMMIIQQIQHLDEFRDALAKPPAVSGMAFPAASPAVATLAPRIHIVARRRPVARGRLAAEPHRPKKKALFLRKAP